MEALIMLGLLAALPAESIAVDANDNRLPAESDRTPIDTVYLAIRADDQPGSGSRSDPFDAGTAAKFDALLTGFWNTHGGLYVNGAWVHGKPLAIRLSRGVFETGSLSSYGPNAGGPFATQHWLARGWTLRGAGMHETEIRNVNPNTAGVWMFSSTGGSWGGPESGAITVSDLTLNPQKSVHEDLATYSAKITHADGKTSKAARPNHGWRAVTRIEVTGENYDGPNGPWNGGGWKHIAAVTPDGFSWPSTNARTGEVTVKRVGEWNGLRLNGASNRVERVRVINAGSNSMAETWPIWVGGDNSIVDSCVVERCSGTMSAIGMFPGTNRTIRHCQVDGAGCSYSHGVSAIETVEKNTIRNTTYAIHADTFASGVPLHIRNNEIENASGGGVVIRPHDHSQKMVVTGNRMRGGATEIGVWIDPLSMYWTGKEWHNAKGELIWIDDVVVARNDFGDKRIEMAQTRGVTIKNNITAFGVFYRMPQPSTVFGNRTSTGDAPHGLEERRIPAEAAERDLHSSSR